MRVRILPSTLDVGFDYAGFAAGGSPIPLVPAILRVRPSGEDDTPLLQSAIDELAAQSQANPNFLGALLLSPGTFKIDGQLRIATGGIVLRGTTGSPNPTRILATGRSRRTLIEIGAAEPPATGDPIKVSADIIEAGSRTISLATLADLEVGDRVVVQRPSTQEWIEMLGMNEFPGPFANDRTNWLPGSRDLMWDRSIVALSPHEKTITLDAPITMALDRQYGGATVAKVISGAPPRQIGIEQLLLESEYVHPCDEEHAWIAIALDQVEDAWVRQVTARHFVSSAVRVGHRARRVTVESCRSEKPVSEIAGYRRQSFIVCGQQILVQRCTTEAGNFTAGFCAAGPNVFRDCESTGALEPRGTQESWACGVLFERVRIHGAALRLACETSLTQGAGWTAANSVVDDCEASEIVVQGHDSAPNHIVNVRNQQKRAPLTEDCCPPSSPTDTDISNVPDFILPKGNPPQVAPGLQSLEMVNGRFVINSRTLWGGQVNAGYWKGHLSPQADYEGRVSITLFVPGRKGSGWTEDLPALAERMDREGMPFYNSGPGIWYDRRRDDHSFEARKDGGVWAPFYEMPWARSGTGTASDGLSKYDLTRFNPWFFERIRQFAELSQRHGLVLYHSLYNSHNFLESLAHWVDFPWRPVNCINETGMPEPPPFDGNNSIHLADQFYNTDHEGRRKLHRDYIRHSLNELGHSPNVVFSLAWQFSGPLVFQEFFLDTIAEWELETEIRVKVALVTSKDITDAILADPVRSKQIAVVDLRYWQTQPDGTLWAPRGDRNRAFREMTSEQFGPECGDLPPPTSPLLVYRQVRAYRDRFPDMAIVAWHGGAGSTPILMAGGAQALVRDPASGHFQGIERDKPPLDDFVRERLALTLMCMSPLDGLLEDADSNWSIADPSQSVVLLYSLKGESITLTKQLLASHYKGVWFSPRDGESRPAELTQSWGPGESIDKPNGNDWLLLLEAALD